MHDMYEMCNLCFVYFTKLYVTCSGEIGNKSERQVSHFIGINSAGYFVRYNQCIPIQELWNSLSITKAYLG